MAYLNRSIKLIILILLIPLASKSQVNTNSLLFDIGTTGDKFCYINQQGYIRFIPNKYGEKNTIKLPNNSFDNNYLFDKPDKEAPFLMANFGNYFSPQGSFKVHYNAEFDFYQGYHHKYQSFVAVPFDNKEKNRNGKTYTQNSPDTYKIEFGTYTETATTITLQPTCVLEIVPTFETTLKEATTKKFETPEGGEVKCTVYEKTHFKEYWLIQKAISGTNTYVLSSEDLTSTGVEPTRDHLANIYKWKDPGFTPKIIQEDSIIFW